MSDNKVKVGVSISVDLATRIKALRASLPIDTSQAAMIRYLIGQGVEMMEQQQKQSRGTPPHP